MTNKFFVPLRHNLAYFVFWLSLKAIEFIGVDTTSFMVVQLRGSNVFVPIC